MGCVHLVGAGPGDPELLTIKAFKLLQTADVVVTDRLISPEVLALIPRGTQRVYVGKARGRHHCSQTEINDLLLRLARKNDIVVRLKGGDPFVFGRGGEEARYLARRGIMVYVVPGLTAAVSATYAGIPLTHRGLANSVTFITGQCHDRATADLDWAALANDSTTIVVYMGLRNMEHIADQLIQAGRSSNTPVCLVENGTTPRQRHHITTLSELSTDSVAASFGSPTVIIIGQVARLAFELGSWSAGDDIQIQRKVAYA